MGTKIGPQQNPGPTSEADQLREFTGGLRKVRAIVHHETFGVDDPLRQLGALDQIIAGHEMAMNHLRSRAEATGALHLRDALVLLEALVEEAAVASDWLEVARPLPRLPRFNERGPLLSTQKSSDRRGSVILFIEDRTKEALRWVHRLRDFALAQPGSDVQAIDLTLAGYESQLSCARALAVTAVQRSAGKSVNVPQEILESRLSHLSAVLRWPRFEEFHPQTKVSVLTAIARLAQDLDHPDVSRVALDRAAHFALSSDPDVRSRAIVNLMTFSTEDHARLQLTSRLLELANEETIGAPFSRDRLGRLSVLRNTLPSVLLGANLSDETGQRLARVALRAQHMWALGRVPSFERVLHVVCGNGGQGRVIWEADHTLVARDFGLPFSDIMRIVRLSENRAGTSAALQAAQVILTDHLAPVFEEIFGGANDEWSIDEIGLAGLLPTLATEVCGQAIATRSGVRYLHPLHGSIQAEEFEGLPDLVLIDRTFGRQSDRVEKALRRAYEATDKSGRVICFDSSSPAAYLDPQEATELLQSAECPLYFGHVYAPASRAGQAGLVVGGSATIGISDLANLSLRKMRAAILVGCASGRYSPTLGSVSVAHALASAGAETIVFARWPLTAAQGAQFVERLLEGLANGDALGQTMSNYFSFDHKAAGLYGRMKP